MVRTTVTGAAPLVLETTYDLESSDVSSILPGIAQARTLFDGGKLDTARAAALLRNFNKENWVVVDDPRKRKTDLWLIEEAAKNGPHECGGSR